MQPLFGTEQSLKTVKGLTLVGGDAMPDKLDEETREELFDMLDEGMSPDDIADELDISTRAVYNYKNEWKEEKDIASMVTRQSGTNEDAVLDAAEKVPGMGGKTREALENALDMSPWAMEDPNELYKLINQVTDLKHYWIDTLVKNAFPQLSSGGGQGGGRGQQSPQYSMGGQQQGPQGQQYPNYQVNQGQGGGFQGQQGQGPYNQQGGRSHQQGMGQQGQPRDPRVDELQSTVEQLSEVVNQMAQQGGEDESDGPGGYIEIEQEDGKTMRMPADDPRASKLFEEEEEDMFETLAKLKNAGLIVSPTEVMEMQQADGDEKDSVTEAMEKLGEMQMQAQQQMSQNFASAIESLKEKEEQEEDLTLEDVENVIEQKLTKDETEQLRDEMDEKFSEVLDKVNRRPAQPAEQDPEFLKADREIQFREKQLEALNNNLNTLPEKLAVSVRDGLVPAMKQLQSGSNPFWSPPGQEGRGEPQYTPQSVQESQQQRQREQAARQEARQQQQRRTGRQRSQDGYPDRDGRDGGQQNQQQQRQQEQNQQQRSQMAQDEPQDTTAQDAAEVREKLNLGEGRGSDGEAMS